MNMKTFTPWLGLLALLIAGKLSAEDPDGSQFADLILSGGKIFTSHPEEPWAEALAIKNGRFSYVGNTDSALEYASEKTQMIKLNGRTVIPGLIDAHAHPGYVDVEQYGEIQASSEEDLLAAVKVYAEQHPGQGWLRLCCWPVDLYLAGGKGPDKRKLDAIVPDRPLWFVSEWWHSGWLNSKALEVLGVDAETTDPKPGVATYVRDENGEATGWVKEGAGWQHFSRQFPVNEDTNKIPHEQGMLAALKTLSEAGVTTLYDAGNFGFEDLVYGFMAGLEEAGNLPVRYEATYQIFTPERTGQAISEMKRYRKAYAGERLQFNTIKLFMDGIHPNHSAGLLAPYADDLRYLADTMLNVEELSHFLLELHREQFDLHIHTRGDLAVQRVLDAVESARKTVGTGFYPRVTMSHLGIIEAADLDRIIELGVICNYTPWWFAARQSDPLRSSLGLDRYDNMYKAKTLFDRGIVVTLSSDEWWGGERLPTYLNPWFGMQVGHTRQYPDEWRNDGDDQIRPPTDERLSIEQLIMGYTRNAAYQLRMEDQLGSIEYGKVADLLILDEDIFELDGNAIWKVEPATILMEGEVIHGAFPAQSQP
jgi:predicted amidohydrolase YtcJ